MLDKKVKQRIISKFKTHPTDTGSPEIQIAILTKEIDLLIKHLKEHKKDNSSRRGLLRKINERRRLLKYLQRENIKSFNNLAKKLKLKVAKKLEQEKKLDEVEDEKDFHEKKQKSMIRKTKKKLILISLNYKPIS